MGEEMKQGPSILSDLCFDINELYLILTPTSYADNVSPFKRNNYLYSKFLVFSFCFYLQSKLLAG